MIKKILLRALGCVFIVLTVIGLALPVVPQVPFMIAAAWCFGVRRETIEEWFNKGKEIGLRILARVFPGIWKNAE